MKVNATSNIVEIEEGKQPTGWDNYDKTPYSNLRQRMRPSLISMAVCGCYTYDADLIKTGRRRAKGRPCRIFGRLYRILSLILSLSACAKAIAAFWTLPFSYLQFNIIILGWYTQSLSVFLIFLKSNHTKYGGQRKAFDFWDDNIKPELDALGIVFPEKKVKIRQRIYLVIAILVSVFNVAGSALLASDTFSEGFGDFYASPLPKSVPAFLIAFLIFTNATLIWIMPMFYITSVSTIFVSTFEVFNEFLENHIKHNSITMTCQFQRIRQLHLNLCKMVSHFDQDFGYYFAMTFVFSVGLACFILYVILKVHMNTLDLVMFFFWLLSVLTLLGAVSVFAAFVNEAVSICTFHNLFSHVRISLSLSLSLCE